MKTVCLIFCLSLIVSINAADNYWCVFTSYNHADVCLVCYNSDLVQGKCTGRKVPGCMLVTRNSEINDPTCQCDPGYYGSYNDPTNPTPTDDQCKVVPQENIVNNCASYYKGQDGTVKCSSCKRGYMPGLSNG